MCIRDRGQKYLSAAMEIKGDKPEDELYKGRISYLLGENKEMCIRDRRRTA